MGELIARKGRGSALVGPRDGGSRYRNARPRVDAMCLVYASGNYCLDTKAAGVNRRPRRLWAGGCRGEDRGRVDTVCTEQVRILPRPLAERANQKEE